MTPMKRVLRILALSLLTAAAGTYFYLGHRLSVRQVRGLTCREVHISVTDSAEHRFVSPAEVRVLLKGSGLRTVGAPAGELDLFALESQLERRSAIRRAQASFSANGRLDIRVTQRRPIARIQTGAGGFYVDREQYFFPLEKSFTAYVPVITGHIPFKPETGFRGKVAPEGQDWMNRLLELVGYLEEHPFWQAQIQQIHVGQNGDVLFYTRVGDQTVRFGPLKDIPGKFRKLNTYYREIVPLEGWDAYREVNLKYRNQIICTKRNTK